MAARKPANDKKKNASNNALAQRLGADGIVRHKGSSSNGASTRSSSRAAAKKNPLLARLDQLQAKHNGKNKLNGNGDGKTKETNPLLERLDAVGTRTRARDGRGSSRSKLSSTSLQSKVNITPASIGKQTQALQSQRLKKQTNKIAKSLPTGSSKRPQRPEGPHIVKRENKTILTIKHASAPNFLKIKNLENGTSASDLRAVLETIGKTKNLRVKDLPSGSAMAEVSFESEAALEKAHRQLNGAIADGRKLKTELSNTREI